MSARGKPRRVRTSTVFQMESTECGAASLAMILAYHGLHKPLEELREACGVSRNGSVARLLIRAADTYGMKGTGYKLSVDQLALLPMPCILHWDFSHFVVLEGKKGGYWHINDPAAGPVRFTEEDFVKHYTGVAIAFEPREDFVRSGKPRGVLAAMLPLLDRVRGPVAAMAWAGLLLVLPGLLLPSMLRIFIDEVLADKGHWLSPLLLALAFTAATRALLVWLQQAAIRRGVTSLAADNTMRVLAHMLTLPMSFFAQREPAMLKQQVALNGPLAEAAFRLVANNMVNCLISLFFLILMCTYSLVLSAIAALTALLSFGALLLVNKRRQILAQGLQMEDSKLMNLTLNGISLMESLRASGREGFFFNEWSNSLSAYADKRQAMQYSSTLFAALPELLSGINNGLILCFGAWRIMEGDMSLGTMMAFMALMGGFIAPVNALVTAGAQLQEMKGVAARLEDVMHYPAEARFAPESSALAEDGSDKASPVVLSLENVSFGYGRYDPPAIRDFSLTLEPGRWVALVGPSGSGKSTLAKLASGLYAPWSGQVCLDGRPLEAYPRSWVVRRIATVDQHILLFSGSIRDNLTLYKEAVDPAVLHQALEDACLSQDLRLRGESSELDIEVGEGGFNFSGGQRQRLEIARALACQAPVLIMDEATSALDALTEIKVYEAVRRRACSCLVIAHRLSTIRYCDEIIVLDKGRIVERGTHEELMNLNGLYAGLMHSQ